MTAAVSLQEQNLNLSNSDDKLMCYTGLLKYLNLQKLKFCIKVIIFLYLPGLILGLGPVNERQRYFVTTTLIGWVKA